MNEKTYIGVIAVTFGLCFFIASLMTIFLPGFGDLHLGFLGWLAITIENIFPSLKHVAFPLAMFLDWIIVFGVGFTIGALIVIEMRAKNKGKWDQFAVKHSIETANSF